jgi:hypothetical protein
LLACNDFHRKVRNDVKVVQSFLGTLNATNWGGRF